ncbi:MAG: nitroreductase family protein [Desulfovibrionaceae bacterium]
MPLLTIDPDLCRRDGLCAEACPAGLIDIAQDGLPAATADAAARCIRCGHCVAVCPAGALTHALLPAAEFLPIPEDRPTADQVQALLLSRRSIRGFRRTPPSRVQLERLLEVARRAPTASNSQKLSWAMIQAPERLERIRALTVDRLRSDPARAHHVRRAETGRDVVLRGAPVLAAVFAPEDYLWGDADGAIALTYMELMAAALGLGACWGGLVTSAARAVPELATLLGRPDGHRVSGALMLGLPRQKHLLAPPRNPVRAAWL